VHVDQFLPNGRCVLSRSGVTTGPSPALTKAAGEPPPYTLIETAKLNDVDPQSWLAHVLACLQDHPAKRIAELLPWNWHPKQTRIAA
jgi:hypothetical protein